MNDPDYELARADVAGDDIRALVRGLGLGLAWAKYVRTRHIVSQRFAPPAIDGIRERFVELALGQRL